MSKNTDHRLVIEIDQRHGLTQSIVCEAMPGSPCVMWCREQCENMTSEHDSHELVAVDCMLIEWWNWDTAASVEGYYGPRTGLRSGPIVVTGWGEDGIEWTYPKPTGSEPAS